MQQDSVANETVGLIENESGNVSTTIPLPPTPPPAVAAELRRLLDLSPIGVMRALEPGGIDLSDAPAGMHEKVQMLTEQFASTLPPEFRRFRGLSRAQRAEEMA